MTKPFNFDLQQFAGVGARAKAAVLSNVAINELSVIMRKGADGSEWAPRNPEARILGLKGGAVPTGAQAVRKGKSVIDRLTEKFGADDPRVAAAKGAWVKSTVPDNVDHDGDGAMDYEQILTLMFGDLGTPPEDDPYGWGWYTSAGGMYGDLQRAMQIQDIDMRSAAITAGVDNFLEALDDIRGGGDGVMKAGARHSKADLEHISAIGDAAQQISDHVAALSSSSAGDPPSTQGTERSPDAPAEKGGAETPVGEDGLPAPVVKAKKDDDDAPYGDVDYADPGYQDDKKKRYPLDTAAHVKSAASYFGMEKNRSKYSDAQQKSIDAKIAAAKKKFDIGDDDGTSKGAPVEVPVTSPVTGSAGNVLEEVRSLLTTFKADLKAEIATEIATGIAKAAPVAPATPLAASIAAVKAAREPSAPGGLGTLADGGEMQPPPNVVQKADVIPIDRTSTPMTGANGAIQIALRNARIKAAGGT